MQHSIIVLNYNTAEMTATCVRSILDVLGQSTSRSFEIIVVDNCSEIGDYTQLNFFLQPLNHVSLIRSSFNSGFGLGNMLGVNVARGEYLTFINSDSLFEEDCFTPLLDYLQTHPAVALITPQHTESRGQKINSFEHQINLRQTFIGRWLYLLTSAANTPNPKKNYDMPIVVDFVYGSFMMFRRKPFAQVGGFDPNIFLYCEEMDIAWRLNQAGYLCVFFPQARFKHLGGGSSSRVDVRYEGLISTLYMLRKNQGYGRYLLFKIGFLFKYGLKGLFRPRYTRLFLKLLFMGPPQASSMRVIQTVDTDFIM